MLRRQRARLGPGADTGPGHRLLPRLRRRGHARCPHARRLRAHRVPGPDGATTALDLTGDDEQRAFTLGDSGGELQDQLSVSDDGRVLAIGNSVLIDLTTGQYMDFADSAPDRPALIAPALMLTKTDTALTATAPR